MFVELENCGSLMPPTVLMGNSWRSKECYGSVRRRSREKDPVREPFDRIEREPPLTGDRIRGGEKSRKFACLAPRDGGRRRWGGSRLVVDLGDQSRVGSFAESEHLVERLRAFLSSSANRAAN